MMEAAAEELEVNAADLDTDGRGNIHVKGAPHRSISTKDVALSPRSSSRARPISGRGIFLVPLSQVDPETGEMTPATCYAHACLGGRGRGRRRDRRGRDGPHGRRPMSWAARSIRAWSSSSSSAAPGWASATRSTRRRSPTIPSPVHGPRDFNEYLMPGPGDICPHDIAVLERPAPDGPFGAKGPGEMCANPVLPARRQRDLQRGRRAHRRAADHAGEGAARDQGQQGGAQPPGEALRRHGAAQDTVTGIDSPGGAGARAAVGTCYLADDGLATAAFLGARARQAAAARRRAGRRQDRGREGDRRRARRGG